MTSKNGYARQAVLALNVFLAARRDGADVPKRERETAANAVVILKPFLRDAEREITEVYGDRPFPAEFFTALLNGFVNAEWERRTAAREDLDPVADAIQTLGPFLKMIDKLLPAIAARSDDDGRSN